MSTEKPVVNTGLRGIPVATTAICAIDGQKGKLLYRGYNIFELVEKTSYEEIVWLLLFGTLPTAQELKEFSNNLRAERALPEQIIAMLQSLDKSTTPMDALQAGLAALSVTDPCLYIRDKETCLGSAIGLVAKTATLVAAWHRIRQGKEPVVPNFTLSHAGNFLAMLTGETPDSEMTSFMDTCLCLHAEHSFNASTFTARQIASTRANMYACVSGAVGSLSGPLHGRANEYVMRMLEEIGSVDAVDSYITKTLNKGEVIMGLGHAVYTHGDPRARILAPMAEKMGQRSGDARWYEITAAVEEKGMAAMQEKKGITLYPNVDMYSAPLYYAMGIPADLFSPIFAVARMAGWVTHVREEMFATAAPKPVLYRPSAQYIGPPEQSFVPLEQRD